MSKIDSPSCIQYESPIISVFKKTCQKSKVEATAKLILATLSITIGMLAMQHGLPRVCTILNSSLITAGVCFFALVIALNFFSKSRNTSSSTLSEIISQEKINQLIEESKLDGFYPAKKPLQESPPDKEKCAEWVNQHPEHLRDLASKFINSLNYICQNDFEKALKSSINDFNNYFSSLPKQRRQYTIILPSCCPRPYKTYHKMSNLWVTMMALPYLKYPPRKILVVNNSGRDKTVECPNEGIKNAVIFDDALYSGRQMTEVIESMELDKKVKLHVIAPFMTTIAQERVHSCFSDLKRSVWIAKHQTISVFFDSLTHQEKKTIKQLLEWHPRPHTLSTIYFDHKIADSWSVFSGIMIEGNLLTGDKGVPFIPQIITPYKH
jgi:hypothetical protein